MCEDEFLGRERELSTIFNRVYNCESDEFEGLLTHPNFQDAAFFALLRSLATRTRALAIVLASRLSAA